MALLVALVGVTACGPAQTLFQPGDHVVIIGGGLADRMQHDGWLEAYLQAELPDLQLVIRNQGFMGDRIDHRPRVEGFPTADEYLVTWTVDDAAGSPRARGQRLSGSGANIQGGAIDFGSSGSGLPYVVVDTKRGSYTRIFVNGFGAFGADRFGSWMTLEIFE